MIYHFLIEKPNGEQRRVKAFWDSKLAKALEAHGLNLEDEVKKFIGHEILEEIRAWEENEDQC